MNMGIQIVLALSITLVALLAVGIPAVSWYKKRNEVTYKLRPLDYYFADKLTRDLVTAALDGNKDLVAELVAKGADPNLEGPLKSGDVSRLRPLHYALAQKNETAVKILMEVGADPDLVALYNGNAYEFAMMLNKPGLLVALLENAPMRETSANARRRAFFESFIYDRLECAQVLLDHGVPIDAQDSAGKTALMNVINQEQPEVAIWLLERGVSPLIETKTRLTPAYAAQSTLEEFREGTEGYNAYKRLVQKMEERGVTFPVPGPKKFRAARENNRPAAH